MKKLLLIAFVLVSGHFYGFAIGPTGADATLATAFANHSSSIQVQGGGQVTKVLADDNDGSKHQRFIIRLASGQTLLIAHNVDLAERVALIKVGDAVEFYGEYEWNSKGGVIHWTHRDPQGRHTAGWIKHNGKTYQ
jgi:Protein of unknown function (DUF3465)